MTGSWAEAKSMTRSWAEINLSNLEHNIGVIRSILPANVNLMGIVKADAYGHGAVRTAEVMTSRGIGQFGTATYEEGCELRRAGISSPVLIMGFTHDRWLSDVVLHDLTQTIFSLHDAELIAKNAKKLGKQAKIHIKIDTGMSRLGFLPLEKNIDEICAVYENNGLIISGIYTHCATSDALDASFMYEQYERFSWFLGKLEERGIKIVCKHMANSGVVAQTIREKNATPLLMDVARIGILLYGYPPSGQMKDFCAGLGLKPVMRLKSRVSMLKDLPAGAGVSYGHLYTTQKPGKIAVLPIGYADGLPRRLSKGGKVLIQGKPAPIAGAICMDQCMIDVTGIPGVQNGDEVILLGTPEEGICADNLAEVVDTISYEILCGIGKRVPRVYIKI